MGWLSKLFGADNTSSTESLRFDSEEYKGFTITPTPLGEAGQYRVSAIIRQGDQEHQFIRSDVIPSIDECVSIILLKSKRFIDEQGDQLF